MLAQIRLEMLAKRVDAEEAEAEAMVDGIAHAAIAGAADAAAGSSPSSKSSAGTSSTSTAVTTVEWSADDNEDGDNEEESEAEAAGLRARVAELEVQVAALEQLERENEELKAQLRHQGGRGGSFSSNGAGDTITTRPSIGEGGTAASASGSSSNGANNTGNTITRPSINRDGGSSIAGGSTSTDATRTGGGGCGGHKQEEKLEMARRIAAERVQAETEEVEAKAKAIVDGFVQEAIARAWADIGLKKSQEKTSQALQNKKVPAGQAVTATTFKATATTADAKRKAATDADDGGAGEAKRRKTMATVEERPGSSCGRRNRLPV